ncbi:MAG: hypothetical protein QOH42_1611 [Blastocatellia bacterium]|nr:hypothetical protein [Blastocatellia bacterium]
MDVNDTKAVIEALLEALTRHPENDALRLHVACVCLAKGNPEEALAQASLVLSAQPDNLEALQCAAQSAEMMGEDARSRAYFRLYEALRGEKHLPSKPAGVKNFPEVESDSIYLDDQESAAFVDREKPLSSEARDVLLDETDEIWDFEQPTIKLADVAGMDAANRHLELAFLGPLKQPELMRHYGKSLRGGLLLYGPPGCGKTFIARATAGELGAKFLAVGLSDVLDMWLGKSEQNLHEVFQRARREAPCVLFFDELDALGRKRSLVRHSAISGVVNQLLAEMDSIGNNNDGVFILAATNHPWDVDTALRRPGRLDRTLLVLPPDLAARKAILEFHLRERPVAKIDLGRIARATEGFSGADLAHVCESATALAIEDSIKSGSTRSITMDDMESALKGIRASTGAWFDTARNFALFANEGGLYDELRAYLKSEKLL